MAGRDMYIGDFEDLVRDHAYRPQDIRFLLSRWGRYNGAPPGTCTVVLGNTNDGDALNVPCPTIPEYTVEKYDEEHECNVIKFQGWKGLISAMMTMRWIRPSEKLRVMLGEELFRKSRPTGTY